jgi:16S rRNA U516 pseudouridylate synthase RsuA-like enzyme
MTDLKRIKYGQVNLGDLPVGKWRYLTKEESKYCQEQIKYWREKGPSWDII